jgi:hypothetical protein
MVNRPNFFIVGAPRCGTTSLYTYLRDHPQVFMCHPKEPHYFAEDVPAPRHVETLEDYLKLFEGATDKQHKLGEGSVWYLSSEHAIRRIYEFKPDARLIAMLRNPIELVVSLHNQHYALHIDDVPDFETAWRLQSARANGQHIPPGCTNLAQLQYKRAGELGTQVQRLMSVFPSDQIMLIIFDDFIARTREIYEDVLDFLGLPSDGRTKFQRVNRSREGRYGRLNRAVVLNRTLNSLLINSGISQTAPYRFVRNLLIKETPPTVKKALSPDFRAELAEVYREEVALLSELVGRDLSSWVERPAG